MSNREHEALEALLCEESIVKATVEIIVESRLDASILELQDRTGEATVAKQRAERLLLALSLAEVRVQNLDYTETKPEVLVFVGVDRRFTYDTTDYEWL